MAEHGAPRRREDEEESDAPPPPDGGWGWVVVFASFMIHVVTDGVVYSFGVFHGQIAKYFHEGNGKTAWILSTLVGVTLCSGPLSSSLVNRWGCRAVTVAGAALASACLVASVWAQDVATLICTIGVGAGAGFGLIYLPAIVSVTTYFEKRRSLATGIAVCGAGCGTFIFAPLIARLLAEYGWRGSILIIAGIVLECVIFGALFRPLENDSGRRCRRRSGGRRSPSPIGPPKKLQSLQPTSALTDLHLSERDLSRHLQPPADAAAQQEERQLEELEDGDQQLVQNGRIQRPHSMGHFSVPRAHAPARADRNGHVPGVAEMAEGAAGGGSKGGGKGGDGEIARLALSQPMLTQSDLHCRHRQFGSQSWRRAGPLDRPDVFYQGSLMNIPSYRSRLDLSGDETAPLERRRSSHSRRGDHDIDQDDLGSDGDGVHDGAGGLCGAVACSREARDTLRQMLDVSLFRDALFVVFVASNFLTSVGFNIPFLYIVPRATDDLGFDSDTACQLLAIMGIANTVGRIVLGYVSDLPSINRLLVYNWCLTLCGIATICSAFCPTFYTLAAYASVFGFSIGAYVGLTSVILVDLLGLDKLTNAFGLLLLFQGVASFVGPPIAGVISDKAGSLAPAFHLAGIAITASGIILFAIPPIQRWQQRHPKRATGTGA